MDYLTETTKTENVFKFQVISVTKVVGLLWSLNPCKSTLRLVNLSLQSLLCIGSAYNK